MDNPFELILAKLDSVELRIIMLEKTRHQSDQEEKLLSPAEACKVFQPNISKQTLHNWSDKGLIQKHHIGGRTWYRLSEITESMTTLKKYKHA